MKEQLVTFETAKLAKEKGFNIETTKSWCIISSTLDTNLRTSLRDTCIGYEQMPIQVHDKYYAPSRELLHSWLRENHNIYVLVKPVVGNKNGYDSFPIIGWTYDILSLNKDSENSYYMGYPILDWFTAQYDETDPDDEEEVKEIIENELIYDKYDEAFEKGLFDALHRVK